MQGTGPPGAGDFERWDGLRVTGGDRCGGRFLLLAGRNGLHGFACLPGLPGDDAGVQQRLYVAFVAKDRDVVQDLLDSRIQILPRFLASGYLDPIAG